MNILDDVFDIKLVKKSNMFNNSIFLGKYNGNDIIFDISFTSIRKLDNISDVKYVYINDRYEKYSAKCIVDVDIQKIYPISDDDKKKFIFNDKKKVIEFYDDYLNNTYNYAINQNIDWIKNILDKKKEVDKIVFEDNDFVVLYDIKWDGDINNPYLLAITKYYNLHSIRDLNGSHINMLQKIYDNVCNIIKIKHGFDKSNVRAYFHYHPSFWHLHIHFNLISYSTLNTCIDHAYSLHCVINNLIIDFDYYKKVSLEIIQK